MYPDGRSFFCNMWAFLRVLACLRDLSASPSENFRFESRIAERWKTPPQLVRHRAILSQVRQILSLFLSSEQPFLKQKITVGLGARVYSCSISRVSCLRQLVFFLQDAPKVSYVSSCILWARCPDRGKPHRVVFSVRSSKSDTCTTTGAALRRLC